METVKYLNSSVYATLKPSPVHGIGVFAIRDIPQGQMITDYSIHTINNAGFLKVSAEEFEQIHQAIRSIILDHNLFQKNQKAFYFYSPNMEVCLTSFMNHSTDANSDGRFALRDIKGGEEITEDYRDMFGLNGPHEVIEDHYKWLDLTDVK